MGQFQFTIMSGNSISQNLDDDVLSIVEIIKDGSTVLSQAANYFQGLLTAPFTCLKALPPRFLMVSKTKGLQQLAFDYPQETYWLHIWTTSNIMHKIVAFK